MSQEENQEEKHVAANQKNKQKQLGKPMFLKILILSVQKYP